MEVIALVSDLLFESKLTAVARHQEVPLRVVRTTDAALGAAGGAAGLIVDLNASRGDPVALVRTVREQQPDLPIVAFLSHVQVELAAEAQAAGAEPVLPRSRFVTLLPDLLMQMKTRSD